LSGKEAVKRPSPATGDHQSDGDAERKQVVFDPLAF
jgi:hypothetical protein